MNRTATKCASMISWLAATVWLGMAVPTSLAHADTPAQFVLQWGSQGGGAGGFDGMNAIATDASGNVYVGESTNGRV